VNSVTCQSSLRLKRWLPQLASTALPAKTSGALLLDLQQGGTSRLDRVIPEDYGFFLPQALTGLILSSSVDGEPLTQLINASTRVSLGYYAGRLAAADCEQLQELLVANGLAGKAPPLRRHDSTSDKATQPAYSRASAQRMMSQFAPDEDLLVIPIFGGGYIPGMQTALFYQQERPNADVAVYPTYYSMRKARHTAPLLKEAEIDYLRTITVDRTIVLHDEDGSNRVDGTMSMAVAFFSRALNHPRVYGIVNLDHRDEAIRAATGEWWENCHQAGLLPE
jgi:hypothetical protein